jgi:ribulose-5-phosphate 4-epimerase/fuculose-1-phosphate aldolase
MHNELTESRRDLAAILRWSDRLGLSEGICNHYSWAVNDSQFLVNPFSRHWSEITASQLLLVDVDGNVLSGDGEVETTAFSIHARIHLGSPGARCVLHTHMPHATAIAAIDKGRLEMISQNALRFYNDVAYDDDYQGLALDATEGDRICASLGDKRIGFLANHGVIVTGPSIAIAFDDLYYLERACQVQVLAQSTHQPLKVVNAEIARRTHEQIREEPIYATAHLAAIRRILDRECPEYAQ